SRIANTGLPETARSLRPAFVRLACRSSVAAVGMTYRSSLMRIVVPLLCCMAALASEAIAAPTPVSAESQKVYETKVKPFLEAHCVKRHNDKVTRAGFRIDTLGTHFLAGKTADHWKEIYDNIALGKMPPKKEPRPNPTEAAVVTDWIIHELRDAERR